LAADRPAIRTALNSPVGLQLWSLREYLPKDLPGTLAKVRAMGFREVEGAGLWKHSVKEVRDSLGRDRRSEGGRGDVGSLSMDPP
jgi:hypothetical protein